MAEDNATNQQVALRIHWRNSASAPTPWGNGREAIQALETIPYDIVLMDVQMPVMDGFEATRVPFAREKTKVPNPSMPIIAMTALAMKGDRERCLDAGMDDYVSKPIAPQALAAVIEKWLAHAKGQRPASAAPVGETGAPKGPPVFDRQDFLARCTNDEDLAREIIAVFLEDTPK